MRRRDLCLKKLRALVLELLEQRFERLHFLPRPFDALHQARVHRLGGGQPRFAFSPGRGQLRLGNLLRLGACFGGRRFRFPRCYFPRCRSGLLGIFPRGGDRCVRLVSRRGDCRFCVFSRRGDRRFRFFSRRRDRRVGLFFRSGHRRVRFVSNDDHRRFGFLARGCRQVLDEAVHQRVKQLFGLSTGVGIKRHR